MVQSLMHLGTSVFTDDRWDGGFYPVGEQTTVVAFADLDPFEAE
jgi:hypothetical protein